MEYQIKNEGFHPETDDWLQLKGPTTYPLVQLIQVLNEPVSAVTAAYDAKQKSLRSIPMRAGTTTRRDSWI